MYSISVQNVTALNSSTPDACWILKPSPMKTVTRVFHLLNTSATRELRVHIEGQLRHDPNPVYIGVTLDRTLSYWQHLQRLPESYKAGIIS